MLSYDTRWGGYVVDLDRNRLERAELHLDRCTGLVRPFIYCAHRRVLAGDLLSCRSPRLVNLHPAAAELPAIPMRDFPWGAYPSSR
jgi:hypothetical protein